ncbi:MAG: sugar ABC transporter permease, partial [Lachnospiraceae bacterium]|nr:sugar ABC transporter permease [Lachnospiraceae bacterium]
MAGKKKPNKMRRREARTGYAFISIWLVGVIFLFLRPLGMAFYYAFQEMTITTEGMQYKFVGFENFIYKFRDDIYFFDSTVWPGLSKFLIEVPICVIFSLFIAIVLNQKFKGRTFARALFFLPVIITSGIAIQVLRSYGLDTSMETENTYLFSSNGVAEILSSAGLPMGVVDVFTQISNRIFDIVWMSGIQIILYLSGLQGIPAAEYEAAQIEGATAWECFWKITWVRISPITLVVVVYSLIDSFTNVSNVMIKFVYEEYSVRGNLGG